MAAVTICSDFGAKKIKSDTVSTVSSSICHEVTGPDPLSSFSECWALSQLFHSPLSLSSRVSLVLLHFLHKGSVICISEVIDISPSNLDSSLCFIQPGISDKLNKQSNNIQPLQTPLPIWTQYIVPCPVLLLLDLHTSFPVSCLLNH